MSMTGSPVASRTAAVPASPQRTIDISSLAPALVTRGDAQPAVGPARRTRIWEFNTNLHCSIIGTCLSAGELRALAVFVQSLATSEETIQPLTKSDREQAQYLYLRNCAACHGPDGGGAREAAGSIAPAPTAFRLIRPAREYIERILETGVPGTAMTGTASPSCRPFAEA